MKVVILRHAETVLNNSGIFCGRTDCDITDHGRMVTKKLASIEPFVSGFTAIYVSPLKRTVQTLNAIYFNCDYIVDERIIEISLGDWEGLKKDSVDQTKRKAFLKGLYTPPNAEENNTDVFKRIISFFKDLERTYEEDDTILLVSHNGIIRCVKQLLKLEDVKNNFIIIDSKELLVKASEILEC